MLSRREPDPYAILIKLGIKDPTSVTSVTGGADTVLWRVQQASETYALRVFRPKQQARFQAEQAAMRLAAEANLPVPRIISSGMWDEYPALLLSWCPGQTLRQQLKLQPWRIWTLGTLFGRMQARIHAVPVSTDSIRRAGDWITWIGEDDIVLQQALRRITRSSISLLHMDYHPHNVIVEENQITGIIDWANVQLGDPRADFARTYTILRVEPWNANPSLSLTLMRWILERAWRHGYREIAGVLEEEMPLFYAWAGAAMVNDLAHRVHQPESWFQERHLSAIQAWTNQWKRHAGLPS